MLKRTKILVESQYKGRSATGVSLHCHTKYSKEFLDFVPYYAEKYPLVSSVFRFACHRFERRHGRPPNFSLGHWEPPLEPAQLIQSEAESLASLSLRPIVSITDHDSIQAGIDLLADEGDRHPISMEWTVPFREAYFHIGVHNLPPEFAQEISKGLLNYTFRNEDSLELEDLLSILNAIPEVLVVLNHPFWDIEMIGQERHDEALKLFVNDYGDYIHAIELNGFRPWGENQLARELADELQLPVVSGGDRHCLHANSMINLTNATSFAEFVEEVRVDRHSEILVRPEYFDSLTYRQVRSISQILGRFESFPASRRRWSQRVYFDWEDGQGLSSLADRRKGNEPMIYRAAIMALGLLGSGHLKHLWKLVDPPINAGDLRSQVANVPVIPERDWMEGSSFSTVDTSVGS